MSHAAGSTGLPLIGETFEFFRDVNRFAAEKFDKYGEISRTNILGTDGAIIWGTENIQEVNFKASNAEVNDDSGCSLSFGGAGFLNCLKTISMQWIDVLIPHKYELKTKKNTKRATKSHNLWICFIMRLVQTKYKSLHQSIR